MTSLRSDPLPRKFIHLAALYNGLQEEAEGDLFTGNMTAVFAKLKISNRYYSQLFYALKDMGCIEVKQRGAYKKPSIVQLLEAPTFAKWSDTYRSVRLTPSAAADKLREDLETLERRIPNIDLHSFILSIDRRLTDHEARLTALEATNKGGTTLAS